MKNHLLIILFSLSPMVAWAQHPMATSEYISTYCSVAIEQMRKYKIPASITLAQGLLESGSGGSRLAVKANNHFGIKCGSRWSGPTLSHDDDAQGECFRSYRSAEESYVDHSVFLTSNQRYAPLFQLDMLDYRAWAYGLKKAGYATSPTYAQSLIKLIEDNNLYKFDRTSISSSHSHKGKLALQKGRVNGVRYVVSGEGDNLESVARGAGISLKKLMVYNDLNQNITLTPGTALYVKAKKKRSANSSFHVVESGQTLHSIAQQYGVKLYSLQRMNPKAQFTPTVGSSLRLR
ncbi:MAG: glucosaminidase domain-containing protein [Mucinivorans sp.]